MGPTNRSGVRRGPREARPGRGRAGTVRGGAGECAERKAAHFGPAVSVTPGVRPSDTGQRVPDGRDRAEAPGT